MTVAQENNAGDQAINKIHATTVPLRRKKRESELTRRENEANTIHLWQRGRPVHIRMRYG